MVLSQVSPSCYIYRSSTAILTLSPLPPFPTAPAPALSPVSPRDLPVTMLRRPTVSLPTFLRPTSLPMPLVLLSDRSATLILALLGASANFYATYKLLTTWFSVRWSWSGSEESEWESLSWKFDASRVLGALVCAYFFVGGVASVVGFLGVLKVSDCVNLLGPAWWLA